MSAASSTNSIPGQLILCNSLTVDFSMGNPIGADGVSFSGSAIRIIGTSSNDSVKITNSEIVCNGSSPLYYANASSFAFDLGEGNNSLVISGTKLNIDQDNTISSGTKVTVDGGILNFNGHANTIGNLTLKNGGQVTATAINNNTTTVESGTLTATSIVCDTLIIGSDSDATSSSYHSVVAETSLINNTLETSAASVTTPVSSDSVAAPSFRVSTTTLIPSVSDATANITDTMSPSSLIPAAPVQDQTIPNSTSPDLSVVLNNHLDPVYHVTLQLDQDTATFTQYPQATDDPSTIPISSTPRITTYSNHILPLLTTVQSSNLARTRLQALDKLFAQAIAKDQLLGGKNEEVAGRDEEVISSIGKVDNRYSPKTNGERTTHLAALESAIQDCRESNFEGQHNFDSIRHNHAQIYKKNLEKVIDIILSVD
jgi:hypothetical protein